MEERRQSGCEIRRVGGYIAPRSVAPLACQCQPPLKLGSGFGWLRGAVEILSCALANKLWWVGGWGCRRALPLEFCRSGVWSWQSRSSPVELSHFRMGERKEARKWAGGLRWPCGYV